MQRRNAIATVAAAASLLAGTAFANVYLKGADVAKLVAGNTIEGQYRDCSAGRQDFAEFYTEDGKIRGHERPCTQAGAWTPYGGTWTIRDGKFCVTLGSGRSSGCFDYQVDKDGTLRRFNAPGVTDLTFKIYDGNPDHL